MSRRARLEEEKLRQLNEDLKGEEDKIKAQRERIYAPIIWARLNSGIRIEDLKPKYYDDVLRLIQEDYFHEEVLCRNADLAEEPASVASFLKRVMLALKDTTSIIALDETNEGAIAGFLLLKRVHQDDYGRIFSRMQLVNGEAHTKFATFTDYLNRKSNIFAEFQCNVFLRYYLLCITKDYRKKGLGMQLMSAAMGVARSLQIPVVMGAFSGVSLQKDAKKLGLKIILEINYVDWKDKHGKLIFNEPGVGNYSYVVMAGEVPPPPPPEPKVVEEVVTTRRKPKNVKK